MNVSTLFYVLENLEGKNEELINLEEIYELEQKYLSGLFGMIDKARLTVRSEVIKNILQSTGTE
ncbi:MAG TPA: hypothetical protein ENI20_13810 [Bacteroides sp.]|nr:hypothetical protein [Bacteroides sp.]